jgi:hypothetical protein
MWKSSNSSRLLLPGIYRHIESGDFSHILVQILFFVLVQDLVLHRSTAQTNLGLPGISTEVPVALRFQFHSLETSAASNFTWQWFATALSVLQSQLHRNPLHIGFLDALAGALLKVPARARELGSALSQLAMLSARCLLWLPLGYFIEFCGLRKSHTPWGSSSIIQSSFLQGDCHFVSNFP